MSKRLPISLVMIARNEGKRLPQSLGSVADWVAEIVVVINDCTDDTEMVAKSFGAVVSEHPFQNLRDQKSVALGKATQPWILSLDADEVVSPELKTAIFRFMDNANDHVNGVWFSRRLWFMQRWIRHGDNYPDRVLRLFRNGKGRLGGTEEHDCFVVDGQTIRFTVDLLHYSHESISSHVGKINFFTDFFLQRAKQNGKKVSALSIVVHACWRFFRAYFLRLGILDGFPGFYLAYFSAFSTFIKYAKLYEYRNSAKE
jgi:glycosyltransferase involved in cell wall biosynthesis